MVMTHLLEPRLIAPTEGKVLHVLGELIIAKIEAEQTGGAFALIEEYTPPHSGPPLHVHHREDELFRIIEGRMEFRCGNDVLIAEPGATVFLPRGLPHTFRNIGSVPSHMQVTLVPGGLEGFFAEVDQLGATGGEPELSEVAHLAEKYGLAFVG